MLKSVKAKRTGVIHCCSLNAELVREVTKIGFYVSFAGPITFKNTRNVGDVINSAPLEKILIETDAPYLSPDPLRGKRNDSRNLKYIAEKIAEIKGKTIEEIAKITYNNAEELFLRK